MKLLSILIVTYNSHHLIEKCLANLFKQNDIGDALEVIIVDNSNSENNAILFELVSTKYPDKVKMIKNDRNGGYGQGNNIGIKAANGKYIAIMNPDITMTEPLFRDTINTFEGHQNLSIIGYKQLGASDLSFYIRPEYNIPIINSFLIKFFNKINYFNKKCMYLSGAFFFARRQCFEDIGYFDENLFLYCEEPDIAKRMLALNKDILFDKRKSYIHEIDDRNTMTALNFKFLLNSSAYYLSKYSFNKLLFLKNMLFEMKVKKNILYLLGKKNAALALEGHINELQNRINQK